VDQTIDLAGQARSLVRSEREKILCEIPETELHGHLKSLFEKMQPDYTVEVTHGVAEYGKDLVIVKRDKFAAQVVGIVVKRGDIKGKTVGHVEDILSSVERAFKTGTPRELAEIESQMRQAAELGAELKATFAELRVTDVYVVIAGTISVSARKRLKGQLHVPIQVFDLTWLVDNFTDFYPQVFFDGRAQNYIQSEIERLQRTPWMSQKGRNLTDYYVDPTFMSCDIPIDLNLDHLAALAELRRFPFQKLPDIITQKGHVLILGDPGSGKSAALAKMALDKLRVASTQLRAGQRNAPELRIPVFLTARELLSIRSAEELLTLRLKDPRVVPEGARIDCLLVDGLDEIPRKDRLTALQRATELADSQKCSVVVASRRVSDVQAVSNGNYARYEILPFGTGQAIELFKHLASSSIMLEALTEGLQRIQLQIPLFPLSLLLLIRLVEQEKEIPASITELYTDFLDIALGKFDPDKGIQVLFEYHMKEDFLAHLAYGEFFEKDRLAIPREDFDSFLDTYVVDLDINREKLQDFLTDLERAGILDLKDEVEFKHRSFLDYFTASYIYGHREEIEHLHDRIVQIYYEGFWEEVAFFYVGLKMELNDDLMSKLLQHEHVTLSDLVLRLLIGRLLQAGWKSTSSVKRRGIDGAIDVAEPIYTSFLEVCRKRDAVFPSIYSDFLMLSLVEASFSSNFLKTQLADLFAQCISRNDDRALSRSILFLWAEQRLMTPGELRGAVEQCSKLLSGVRAFLPAERARYLWLLKLIGRKDRELEQLITKKLKRLTKVHPDVMKGLLPYRQPLRSLKR
jgi:hypothetical protein